MHVFSGLCPQVKEIFDDSPFFVPNNSVTIMNGINEGTTALMKHKFKANS